METEKLILLATHLKTKKDIFNYVKRTKSNVSLINMILETKKNFDIKCI